MSKHKLIKIIIVAGPTASGKSDLGIRLAQKYNGEIISADSRQVYKGMDIGTGKVLRDKTLPSVKSKIKNQKSKFKEPGFYSYGIKHYLINAVSPKKIFTASDFKKLGDSAIKNIIANNKMPIVVGGTGFYIDVLLGKIDLANVPPDKKLRSKLEKLDTDKLFKRLQKLDPKRAQDIDFHNRRRLIRAIEIGVVKDSDALKSTVHATKYTILWLGINPDKKILSKKIEKRLDQRLDDGMIKEVINLRKNGLSWKRMDNMGLEYRWISRWLRKNQISKIKYQNNFSIFKKSEEYKDLLQDIIRYSKRQMTWFKRNEEIHWIKNLREADVLAKKFIAS